MYLLMIQKVFREEIHIKVWRVQQESEHFTNAAFKSFRS